MKKNAWKRPTVGKHTLPAEWSPPDPGFLWFRAPDYYVQVSLDTLRS